MTVRNKGPQYTPEQLDYLVDETGSLHSKLTLLISRPGNGKTALFAKRANQRDRKVMNVGGTAGRRLAAIPQRQRALQTNVILRELADEYASGDLLLPENIELLFR